MAELLAVPLKKPTDVDIVKPLKNLISASYSTSDKPQDFSEAINELSKLRTNAVWRVFEKYESSLEIVYSYYDQLCALEGKIPSHEVQIPFKWKEAFDKGTIFGGRLSLTVSSLAYEKVCVLFNIAALQSSVASAQSLESDDGLKLAAKLFQQAAGIFNHLKGTVMLAIQQDPTPDLNPETLGALSSLMLAQAQEIFVQKAIHDRMKDAVIAKLSAQCEELYVEVLKLVQKEILRPLWEKDWIPIHAIELFKTAQQRSGKPSYFQDFANKAQRNLTEAKKDNDFIYHERIPDAKSLPPVGKAMLAKALPLPERLSQNFKDLFEELVPVTVHQALAAYDVRKNEIVNSEIMKLRESTQFLNSVLASLNLPAALEDTVGNSLPQSLVDKAAAIQSSGGVLALEKMIRDLPDLLQRNRDILDETERMLQSEKEADDQLREQFKEKWTRISSEKLTDTFRANIAKYREIINNAMQADKVVRDKFETHRRGMELLSKGPAEMQAAVPSGGPGGNSVQNSSSVHQLRKLMEDVQNTEFCKEKSGAGAAAQREAMLKELAAAHDAYIELKNNLSEGSKFYNDLTQILLAFQNKISDFCFARKTEKEEHLKDLTQDLGRQGPGATPAIPAHHATGQEGKKEPPPRPPPPSVPTSSTQPPPVAPGAMPYPVYPQGMPVPYGATAAAPYPTYMPPSLPTSYNPYASVPYPQQGCYYTKFMRRMY
ncbi:Programmed cell death 6-interacting protein [Blattella germanica]|nr:Programmed cell death 6-interacting protein [Blattella germanica]